MKPIYWMGWLFAANIAYADHAATVTPVSTPQPLTIIINPQFNAPVGASLFDKAKNPSAGSLTSPSIAAATENLLRTPGAVGLVTSEKYDHQYTQTLKDMVGNVPGVYAEKRFGEEVRLSIRGSGLGRSFHMRGIELLQDGIPINLADGSGDFQEIDPLISRYVEVYKGGNGLQYGSSALGGAINIITPSGRTQPTGNQTRVEAGSNDFYRVHANRAEANDDYDYYVAATGLHNSGFRDHSTGETERLSSNVGVRLNESAENRTYVTYNHIQQHLPGTVSYHDALHNPRQANAAAIKGDWARDIRSTRVSNKTSVVLDSGAQVDVGVFGNNKDLYHPISVVVDQESFDYGAFSRYLLETEVAGYRNRFVAGARVKQGKVDAETFLNINGSAGNQIGQADQRAQQYDMFVHNDFFVLDDLSLVSAVQWIKSTREFDNFLNAAASDDTEYIAINPKAGFVWDITSQTQLFANVSRSEEAPTFSELVQTPVLKFVPLNPQQAWTQEIGVRGHTKRLAWDVAIYHSDVHDELLNYTVSPGIPASTFNADDTTHQGVELGVELDIGQGWLLPVRSPNHLYWRQMFSYNDFYFENDAQYGNNQIPGIPRQIFNSELRYEHADWRVTPGIEWVPEGSYVDYANTFQAEGYTVFNLNITQRLNPTMQWYIDLRNVANEKYVATFSPVTNYATVVNKNIFYPGDGAGAFVGVEVDW